MNLDSSPPIGGAGIELACCCLAVTPSLGPRENCEGAAGKAEEEEDCCCCWDD